MRVSVRLFKETILRVAGPANIKIKSGRVLLLGKILSDEDSVSINAFKSYPLYSLEESEIEVELGSGGYVEYPREDEEVLPEWVEIAQKIVERDSRIVVVGPVESGKSTLSTLLLNTGINRGLKTCVIDADIGQQDIGPPGFIAMSCPREPVVWLRELTPDQIRFIGSLTPSQYASRIIAGTIDLVNEALSQGADVVIVNTDGWISTPQAVEMKIEIAKYVRARYLLALQKGYYLGTLSGSIGDLNIIPLSSPQSVRVRSREERKILRSMAYKKFFDGAAMRTVDLKSGLLIIGSCLASGERLDQAKISELEKSLGVKILYASKHENTVYAYTSPSDKFSSDKSVRYQDLEIQLIPQGSERGLIASILDRSLREVAPAIIDALDFSSGVLKLLTRYEGSIAGVIIGRVKLDSLYDDSVRYVRCPV